MNTVISILAMYPRLLVQCFLVDDENQEIIMAKHTKLNKHDLVKCDLISANTDSYLLCFYSC